MAIEVSPRYARRLLIVAAAICGGVWAFANGSSVRGQPPGAPVVDIPNDAETRPAIINMTRQGIMRTRTVGRFAPAEATTLGEYLISLQQLFRLSQPQHSVNFTDVPPSSPYYAAVQATAPYLYRQVLCFGCALGTNLFPEQPLTRLQSTVSLVGILGARGALPLVEKAKADQVLQGIEDAKALSPLARRFVATAISGGVISLSAPNRAQLSQVETRANTAVMLNRAQTRFQLPQVH
jgi:hypothetical protein